MKKKIFLLTSLVMALAILAAACSPKAEPTPTVDTNALMTEIAMTVEAELTQTAQAAPPTATMEPTATLQLIATQNPVDLTLAPTMTLPVVTQATLSSALPTGDDSEWVEDVTVKDKEVFYENEYFKKVWKVKNIGTTTWTTDYALVNIDDNTWGSDFKIQLTETVPPGSEVNLSVSMRAPYGLGEHWSRWFLMNANGQTFGQELYILITVGTIKDKTPTPAG